MKKLIVMGMASIFSFGAAAATMSELEQRIEDLEYKSYEDIFRFGGSLEMRYDTLASEDKKTDTKTSSQIMRSWFNLDMSAKSSDKLSFYGRLSMAKYLNRFSADETVDLGQLQEGQGVSNSEVYVQRAFVNYKFTNDLIFTFGRIPTGNGSPYHLTRNEAVGGAYPYYLYNAFLDALALSYKVNNFDFKLIYSPIQFIKTSTAGGANTPTAGNNTATNPESTIAGQVNYSRSDINWARNFKASLSYLVGDIPFYVQDRNGLGAVTGASDIGLSVNRTVFSLDVSQLAKSNFDFNLQVHHQSVETLGSVSVPVGGGASAELFFLTDDGSKVDSTNVMLTGRYSINANNKIGFQYAQGSRYTLSADIVRKDGIEMTVAGKAYHVFYNHDFQGGLKLNVGYQWNEEDYDNTGGLGPMAEVDRKNEAVYTSFVANF